MTKKVPYMKEEDIEQDAAALLAEYARARGVVIVPPIPIEDILEKHLKLGIEFDDTHNLFGIPRSGTDPDILGAMFFNEERIVIDESLDPEEHPAMEGRYRFTLAHEGGGQALGPDRQGYVAALEPVLAQPVVVQERRARVHDGPAHHAREQETVGGVDHV
jgi:hypothetical protein